MNHSTEHTSNHDAADLAESISIMIERESTTYSCLDYLSSEKEVNYDSSAEDKITPDDRMALVDWCYGFVDRCEFKRETVAVAMNIVDRFMCASVPQARDALYHRAKYQLVAVTALYMSIKLYEFIPLFGINDFADMSNGTYSAEEIQDMEWTILHGLEWRVCPPTSLQVGHHIHALIMLQLQEQGASLKQNTWDFIRDEVAFQVESAEREYYFMTQRRSTIAIAAIFNAFNQVRDEHDYKLLMLALLQILQDFQFDPAIAIKAATDKLHCLLNTKSEKASNFDAYGVNDLQDLC
eukprot:CAMPEP_0181117154 /NCGR_PEP_ID=MMETSP1071-20121207/22351_1 /TAXON_ID=35127 /ORGANISM="Thalassiosira sp., Strain NH16" /LENGTH=294 /DNA_ID=CAMNT_0023201483 /DNA_START=79 /DNA_END=963 /DNA_ORIENTATION=-